MNKRKTLISRFNQLSFWNKLGAIGSLASILGILLYFWPSNKPPEKPATEGSLNGPLFKEPDMVFVDSSFSISKYEITNREYLEFCEETKYGLPDMHNEPIYNGTAQPVVGVSWNDAMAYCTWLTAKGQTGRNYRLPTHSQWKIAAGCVNDSLHPSTANTPDKNRVNFGRKNDRPLDVTRPFGEETELGIRDMGGNVAEWCYDVDPNDPTRKIVCGGNWLDNKIEYLKCSSYRSFPPADTRKQTIGFRIVSIKQ